MRLLIALPLVMLLSCEFFKPKEIKQVPPVARAEDKYLYPQDLEGLFPKNVTDSDSVKLAEKYVEDWVKKQLMISQSAKNIDVNEAEIERKVLDYRYALVVHSYIKSYIDSQLNTEVSDEEIQDYYQDKSDNFLLKQSIVKCIAVQIPKTAPDLWRFRRNFKNYPEKETEWVQSYVSEFASKSFMDDSVWVIFDDVIVGTPLENIQDKSQFLERNQLSETADDQMVYFLKIMDYKTSDEVSPLEFILQDIINIIINKRKIALKSELEEKIYEQAKEQGLFEVFRD